MKDTGRIKTEVKKRYAKVARMGGSCCSGDQDMDLWAGCIAGALDRDA